MKKLILLLCLTCFNSNRLQTLELEEITYESLRKSPYTDHVAVFGRLFKAVSIQKMIEFGLGLGTKFFLDHMPELTSIEIVNQDQSDSWYQDCCALYKNYSNWRPVLVQGSFYLTQANNLALQSKNPSLYDKNYLLEIKQIVLAHTEGKYDLAFVDPGIHNRCDIVQCLFNRVDIIAAHDTNSAPEIYGWNRIVTPQNYQKISFTKGVGLTFWVHKERKDVIRELLKIKKRAKT